MPRSHTMLEALAWAARRARQTAHVARWTVAAAADVDDNTIRRFERARAWPVDPERIVNAYAELADLHPREIWQAAVNAWGDDQ